MLQAGPDDAEEAFQAAVATLQASPCWSLLRNRAGYRRGFDTVRLPRLAGLKLSHGRPPWIALTLPASDEFQGILRPEVRSCPRCCAPAACTKLHMTLIMSLSVRSAAKSPPRMSMPMPKNLPPINGKWNGEQKQTVAACSAWSACIRTCVSVQTIFLTIICASYWIAF